MLSGHIPLLLKLTTVRFKCFFTLTHLVACACVYLFDVVNHVFYMETNLSDSPCVWTLITSVVDIIALWTQ